MGNIVLLDDLTINKIAAGEVIERPASVVKEMVENSIDAGADNINIEIRNGGISYIRITDNGKGIMPDDMEMAFERHATSKIRKAEDLSVVTSMGFRGEALASIASIARVTVTSKTADSDFGYKVIVEGGNILEKTETGAQKGTTMVVENLFYNTPVRYKFLKKDYTEAGYIEDVITRIALVNPNIAFKLVSSGKTIIQTSGNGDIKSVIYNIYGRDIADNIINVNYQFEDISVNGVIGKPSIARSNRTNQLFFVNKRHVKDKTLTAAAEQSYKGMLTVGKYAFLVLNLGVKPEKVDVNVHPAKLEVRFEEESKIFKAVYHAIKESLLSGDLIPEEKKNNEMDVAKEEMEKNTGKNEGRGLFGLFGNKNEFANDNNVIEQLYKDRNKIEENKTSWEYEKNETEKFEDEKQVNNSESVLEDSLRRIREIQESMKQAGYKPSVDIDNVINKKEDANSELENDTDKEFEKQLNEGLENDYQLEEEKAQEDSMETKSMDDILDIIERERKELSQDTDESDELVKSKIAELEALNQKIQDLKKQVEQDDEELKDDIKESALNGDNSVNDDFNQEETSYEKNTEDYSDLLNVFAAGTQNDIKNKSIKELNVNVPLTGTEEKSDEEENNIIGDIAREKYQKKFEEESVENNSEFGDMYEKLFGKPAYLKLLEEEEKNQRKENETLENEMKVVENISLFDDHQEIAKRKYKFLGIAFSTYIIIELDNEMYIIDQHAAHERIMYEKIKANYYNDDVKDSQLMLLPDIITLTNKEMGIVKDNMDVFEKAGFQLKEFGENTIRLDGVPDVCIDLETKELFLETLDEINTVARTAKQEIEEKFIATVACKAAVKANMALTEQEVDALMEKLLELPNPFTCPHGRPTAIKMSRTDIEKKFSRR